MALNKTFIAGADQISKTLDALSVEIRSKLTGKAVGRVGDVMLAGMQMLVPVRHGALKLSLSKKTVVYKKDAAAVSLAGAARKQKFTTPDGVAVPSKYLHLVEFGHIDRSGKFRPPHSPFVRPAVDAVAPKSGDIMSEELSRGIEQLVKRYKKTVAVK